MRQFLEKPFPYFFSTTRGNFVFAGIMGAYVVLFLIAFAPWGVLNDGVTWFHFLGYGGIVFLLVPAMIYVGEKFFNTENWTLGKHLVFSFCLLSELGIAVFLFNISTRVISDNYFLSLFIDDLLHTILIGVPPLLCAMFFVNYLQLQEHLKATQKFSTNLIKMHNKMAENKLIEQKNSINIISNTKENFQVQIAQVLFAQSQDNYVEIFYTEDGLQKKVLRMSLSKLYQQLNEPYISQCHRSYLVNINHIISADGNSNGMQLTLEGVGQKIPVSRSYVKQISEQLSQSLL